MTLKEALSIINDQSESSLTKRFIHLLSEATKIWAIYAHDERPDEAWLKTYLETNVPGNDYKAFKSADLVWAIYNYFTFEKPGKSDDLKALMDGLQDLKDFVIKAGIHMEDWPEETYMALGLRSPATQKNTSASIPPRPPKEDKKPSKQDEEPQKVNSIVGIETVKPQESPPIAIQTSSSAPVAALTVSEHFSRLSNARSNKIHPQGEALSFYRPSHTSLSQDPSPLASAILLSDKNSAEDIEAPASCPPKSILGHLPSLASTKVRTVNPLEPHNQPSRLGQDLSPPFSCQAVQQTPSLSPSLLMSSKLPPIKLNRQQAEENAKSPQCEAATSSLPPPPPPAFDQESSAEAQRILGKTYSSVFCGDCGKKYPSATIKFCNKCGANRV